MARGSGSAGGGGYDLQACVIALVGIHILAEEPLHWFTTKDWQDVPIAVSSETEGPGDDLRVELRDTQTAFEIQAKRGLSKGPRFNDTIDKFAKGLEQEPTFHCILAIDTTASRPIQYELPPDLDRLRDEREDHLHPITKELLKRLATQSVIPARELVKRISVQIFDIEGKTTQGRRYEIQLLKGLLANPQQAEAAWSTLYEDAMKLIKHRGRRDVLSLARVLRDNSILLAENTTPTAFSTYTRWVENTTATFIIPGLGTQLPIEDAWITLHSLSKTYEAARPQTVEAKIASYHEWERLAYQERKYEAQKVAELSHRAVVIGGAGAGKSTLCQRAAYHLARQDKRVLRVRLPLVTRRHFHLGESIDEAIIHAAIEGSSINSGLLSSVLNKPDCLLADGLDECDPYRSEMAELIRNWAMARPSTRVVVTTRPIGHDPAFFEEWNHLELLPINRSDIEAHAKRILSHIETNSEALAQKLHSFQLQINNNRVAAMAARSPLLLGFLIQLAHQNVPFAQYRAELYKQVITLWYRTSLRGREVRVLDPGMISALDALYMVGWSLQQATTSLGGRSPEEVVNLLTSYLQGGGYARLQAREKAEQYLAFWCEKGVLELLQFGHEEAYTFVHASLGEFAAGQYIAKMPVEQIKVWLENVHYDTRWRETILLAAGAGAAPTIAEHLISLDRENDPLSTESLLAAAVLTETGQIPLRLVTQVIERIRDRLLSPIPLVAYESAESGIGLASQAPELVAPLLQPLFRHSQLWTRLSALRLALAAGEKVVDIDALKACLDEQIEPNDSPVEGSVEPPRSTSEIRGYILGRHMPWTIWNEIVALGFEMLARLQPNAETAKRLEQYARRNRGISAHTFQVILGLLSSIGYKSIANEIIKESASEMEAIFAGFDLQRDSYRRADLVILETVLRITGPIAVPIEELEEQRPLAYLAMLVETLQLPQSSIGSWQVLGDKDDLAAMEAVFTGTIAILKLDQTELAKDARWALKRLQETSSSETLLGLLPELPVNPDWTLASSITLQARDLVRALLHPSSAIALGAAQLLANGARKDDVSRLLEEVLENGGDYALRMVAGIALSVWGKEAVPLLLKRLEKKLTPGCRWLLRVLPYLSEGLADKSTQQAFLRSLIAEEPHVAITAAEIFQSFPSASVRLVLPKIKSALHVWQQRGDYCRSHAQYVYKACCDSVPLSPRSEIIKLLSGLDELPLEELLKFSSDWHHTVRENAIQGIAKALISHPEQIAQILNGVAEDHYSPDVLEPVLSLPAQSLQIARQGMIALFSNESSVVRRIMVRSLAKAQWLPKEEAVKLTKAALGDRDPTVRDRAILTLRALGGK